MSFEKELKDAVNLELDKADDIWNQVKDDFLVKATRQFSIINESQIPSKIPGFPFLKQGQGKVGNFVALVLDIRDSTQHLLTMISEKTTTVNKLQRVYYEMTAVNICGLMIVKKYKGGVTEFLGDGFLALFEISEEVNVHNAHNAAKKCLETIKEIVNPILKNRYNLPDLAIGIGLAYSQAIVTIIGSGEDLYPKAIGECVFRASKLSNGYNQILFDEHLKLYWPKETGGTISFVQHGHKHSNDVTGYKAISKKTV